MRSRACDSVGVMRQAVYREDSFVKEPISAAGVSARRQPGVVHSADDESASQSYGCRPLRPKSVRGRTTRTEPTLKMHPLPSRPIDIDGPIPEGNARRW